MVTEQKTLEGGAQQLLAILGDGEDDARRCER